jgi:lysophospholipase L1-like esterase
MNKYIAILLSVGLSVQVLAAEAPVDVKPQVATEDQDDARPLSVVPVEQTMEWATFWPKRHKQVIAKRSKMSEVDLVFVGDSILHYLELRKKNRPIYSKYFGKRKVLNLGFMADRTEHVLWRMMNGEIDGISPKLAILLIGTNNSAQRKDSAEDIAAGIKAILDQMKKRLPETKILLLAILPCGDDDTDPARKLNIGANMIIKDYADNKVVFFLDLSDKLLDDERMLREDLLNGLHPTPAGYEVMFQTMDPMIKNFLGEK